jgi:cell division protein ZapA (FtsZ GTPase activity inhibitor)
MAKDEKKTITVNDVEYNIDDLTPEQKAMVNHVADLNRKLSSARFNVEQLTFGRDAFVNALAASLENDTTDVAAE